MISPATLALFISGLAMAMVMPYQPIVGIEIFKFTSGEYAAIVFASSVVSVLASLALGLAADEISNRSRLLAAACFIVASGYGLVWLSPSRATFAIAHVACIPLLGGIFAQLFALIRVSATSIKDRDAAVTTARTVFAFSWVLAPALAALLISASMPILDVYFYAYILSLILLTVLAISHAPQSVGQLSLNPSARGLGNGIRRMLSRDVVLPLVIVSGASASTRLFLMLSGLLIAALEHGSARQVGLYSGIFALLEIPFMLVIPRLLKVVTRGAVLAGGCALFAIFMALLSQASSVKYLYAIMIFGAVGNAAIASLSISFLQDLLSNRPGLGGSLITISGVLAVGLSSLIFSVGVAIQGYGMAALGGSILCAICGLGLYHIERQRLLSSPPS